MSNVIYKDDLNRHIKAYVLGQCVMWNDWAKQFTAHDLEFNGFVNRTLGKCMQFLHKEITLDGSCSDFECSVAADVVAVFHDHLINVLERERSQLAEYGNIEQAGEVRHKILMLGIGRGADER